MIDQLVVFAYLIIILFIGIYHRSDSFSFKGFATLQGKLQQSRILLIATIFTSSVGGGTCFGISQKVFVGDFSYAYGLFFTIIIDILIAIYLVPRIALHHGAESVGDIMDKYYWKEGRILSGIAATIVSTGFVAAQINVSGHIFRYLIGIEHAYGVILSYFIVIIYTTIGGLKSIMFTNLLQFFAMIVAIPILVIIGINTIGMDSLIANAKELMFSNEDLTSATFALFFSYSVMNLYPSFIQRILINKNAQATSGAIYMKSIIYGIFLILIIFSGIISYVINKGDIDSTLALPLLIKQIIPVGLQGFIIIGFLSAVMSTADADLHITSVSLAKDILNPIFDIKSSKLLLLIARFANVVIGIITIIIALNFQSVVDLVIFITGFWGPMILVPLIFALYNITIPNKLLIFVSLSGVAAFLVWEKYFYDYFYLKGVFVGTMVSLALFIVIMLCGLHKLKK